jgi:hypothetical protein
MAERVFFSQGKADDAGGLAPVKEENAALRKKDRLGAVRSFARGLLYKGGYTGENGERQKQAATNNRCNLFCFFIS